MNAVDAVFIEREIDDPSHNPAYPNARGNQATRTIQVRASSIDTMHARKQIDQAQYVTAKRFEGIFERAGQGGVKAIDPGVEAVDGGKVTDGLPASRMDALTAIHKIRREIGEENYVNLIFVCCEGNSIRDLAARMFGPAPIRFEREQAGRDFRKSLDRLARYWGYS